MMGSQQLAISSKQLVCCFRNSFTAAQKLSFKKTMMMGRAEEQARLL
jgi:hypothetical protein